MGRCENVQRKVSADCHTIKSLYEVTVQPYSDMDARTLAEGLALQSGIDCIPCYNTTEYTTAGKIIFSDYEIFESDDTHEALEGYEWRAITKTIIFDDENAYYHGYSGFALYTDDYYNSTDDTYNEDTDAYTLNYNGIDYSEAKVDSEVLQGGWDDAAPITDKINDDTVFFRLK